MNKYIKPTVQIVLNASARSSTSSCSTSADMDLIQSIIGGADADKTFGMNEPCELQIPLEMYCKFTSSEMGAAQIFWS